MIRELARRLRPTGNHIGDPRALREEVDRLTAQNEKLRRAMRHCIDCEYRIEVLASRTAAGHPAAGETTDPAPPV